MNIKVNNWKWNISDPAILDGWFPEFKLSLADSCELRKNRIEIVKSNSERDVFRFEQNGRGYFAKFAHPASIFQKTRAIISPKLESEFNSIALLNASGIAVVDVVGWGSCGSESMLITEELEDAESVRDFWFTTASNDEAMRKAFLAKFAEFLKTFLNAGIFHPDFHPGNLMIVRSSQKIVLVDPYGVVKKNIIPDSDIFEMLCIIGAFRGEIHDNDGIKFISKVKSCSNNEASALWHKILEHETSKSEKLWSKRAPKAFTDLRNSQVFTKDQTEIRVRKSIVRKFMINPDNLAELDNCEKYECRTLLAKDAKKEWMNSLYLQIHRIPHKYPIAWSADSPDQNRLYYQKEINTLLTTEEILKRNNLLFGN